MKQILIFILLVTPTFLKAQSSYPVDSLTKQISYTETISVTGTKNQLYSKAKEWFIKAYNSGKDVIQLDDPANGKIIGKGVVLVETPFSSTAGFKVLKNYVDYLITINVKDGKYRYSLTDFEVTLSGENGKIFLGDLLKKLQRDQNSIDFIVFENTPKHEINNLITGLKAAMVAKDDF